MSEYAKETCHQSLVVISDEVAGPDGVSFAVLMIPLQSWAGIRENCQIFQASELLSIHNGKLLEAKPRHLGLIRTPGGGRQ